MSILYRPICLNAAPKGATRLAGGQVWFTHVQPMETGKTHAPIPARDVPGDVIDALTRARPNIAELPMTHPQLMGVLNVTPDSFSDGGQFNSVSQAVEQARKMTSEGASVLDIGGESTRPGAAEVSVQEEIARTAPVIVAIRSAGIEVPISIDTRKGEVAQAALEAGATMINDVSAMSFDAQIIEVAKQSDVPICLMHAQGTPETMQKNPSYGDVVHEVYAYLKARIELALASGIKPERLILDPGIGFGKTLDHNLALIRNLSVFHGLGCPLLLGVSRKKFIGTLTDVQNPADRGWGSAVMALEGIAQGVQIIRAHDIEEHRQTRALWQALRTGEGIE